MAAEEVSEDSVQIIDNKKRRNRAVANASFPDAVKKRCNFGRKKFKLKIAPTGHVT